MKYKALFSYKVLDEDGEKILYKNHDLPIVKFQVGGGVDRMIDFNSTDDISLMSELKEAQTLSNIVVKLAATKDHKDMRAALELTDSFYKSLNSYIFVVVERYSNGKLLEGFLLKGYANLRFAPRIGVHNTLAAKFKFSEGAELLKGKINDHFVEKGKPI